MRTLERSAVLGILATVVLLLWAYPWLATHRLALNGQAPKGPEILVTSSFDSGPGSLRAAMFAALRSDRPAVIVIRPAAVVVQNPLPPLVSAQHLLVRSEHGRSEIDASALRASPLFDVRGDSTAFENLAIRGASITAIRAAGKGRVALDGVQVAGSAVGLSVAGNVELEVSGVEFLDNGIGIELTGEGRTVVEDSVFRDQSNAGIWYVPGAGSMEVANASFEGGRYGLVLGNGRTDVRSSAIRGFGANGILALGGTLNVSESRIGGGSGTGVHAARVDAVALTDNEIFDVRGMGMLLQAVAAGVVNDNRLYRNGYGIATITSARAAVKLTNNLLVAQELDGVVLFGDSPIVTGNRALRNGAAGIRVLNLKAFGTYTRAQPLLADNVLLDNGIDEPEFGEYVLETPRGAR
jgi:hypothetical protein